MPKTPEFFGVPIPQGTPVDPAYRINRESVYRTDIRQTLQQMWHDYRAYCPDDDFQVDAMKHFQSCAWQMQITAFFRQRYQPEPVLAAGPDLRFRLLDERIVLVEAVSAKPGTGADAVQTPPNGQPYHPDNNAIIIRLRNAIDSKIKQHARWLASGVVSRGNPLIVAVTAGEISTAMVFSGISHMEQALFPLDDGAWHIPIRETPDEPEQPIEFKYGFRGSVAKRNGSAVTTDVFVTNEAEYVSAVLYSPHHFANSYHLDGRDFRLLHNPNALNPLPRGIVGSGLEAWVEGDVLHFKDWRQNPK